MTRPDPPPDRATRDVATERLLRTAEVHVEAAREMSADQSFEDARRQWLIAAELYAEAGANDFELDAWMHAGLASERVGDLAASLDYLTRSASLARQPGMDLELGTALAHLSRVEIAAARVADGVAHAHEAMDLGDRVDNPRLVAQMAGAIADLELRRGALDEAARLLDRAHAAWHLVRDTEGLGLVANQRGELARARHDLDGADRYFSEAVTHFSSAQSPGGVSLAMANRGNIARVQGKLARAETLFGASYNLAVASSDPPAIARARTNLGNLAAVRGQLEAARAHYEAALAIDKRFGHAQAVAGGLVNLASLLATEGRLAEAVLRYDEALALLRPLRAGRTTADLLAMIGQLEARQGHLGVAERRFDEALQAARAAGHTLGEARIAVNLAAIAYARGQVDKARQGYQQAVPKLEAVAGASDLMVLWLVIADAALAAADGAGAEAAVESAATRLEDPSAREAIDIAIVRLRVQLARAPDASKRAELLAVADQLDAEGRRSDAVSARLVALDLGPAGPNDHELATRACEVADALGARPLIIDAHSLRAALAGGHPSEVEPLVAEADRLGLGLLSLRARRRLAATLEAAGRGADAHALRQAAMAQARQWGARAEIARLDATASRSAS